MGPFPSDQGEQFIVSCISCLPNYIILVPIHTRDSATVAKSLVTHVISYFGIPNTILSDCGTIFTSSVSKILQLPVGCTLVFTSPCHLQDKAIAERSHCAVNNLVCTVLVDIQSNHLVDTLLVRQLSIHPLVKITRIHFSSTLFGQPIQLPTDKHLPSPIEHSPL